MKEKNKKQMTFSKYTLKENYLPFLIELQHNSFNDFLQKDVPLEEKKLTGIHKVLMDYFGLAGTSDIYITKLPEDDEKKGEMLNFLAKYANIGIQDVKRIISYNLPLLRCVKDKEVEELKTKISMYGGEIKVQSSGWVVNVGDAIYTIQYNGYKLEEPQVPLEDSFLKHTYNLLSKYATSSLINYNRYSCKYLGKTYASRLVVNFRLIKEKNNKKEVIDEEVYLADIPLMTKTGSFIINGAERVVITQIHKYHGVFFEEDEENEISKEGKKLYRAKIAEEENSPAQGPEFSFDNENVLYVSLGTEGKKILVTIFLRALGITNKEIKENLLLSEEINIEKLAEEIGSSSSGDGKKESNILLATEIINKETGEVIYDYFTPVDDKVVKKLKELKVEKVEIIRKEKNVAMFKTLIKDEKFKTQIEAADYIIAQTWPTVVIKPENAPGYLYNWIYTNLNIGKLGRMLTNRKLDKVYDELKNFDTKPSNKQTKLTLIDILATIKYLLHLNNNEPLYDGTLPESDDVDHLGSRHLVPVGEQLMDTFRDGIRAVIRSSKEQISQLISKGTKKSLSPKHFINNIPLNTAIKKFFTVGELSQFLDKTNLLSDLTSKRRISALGKGGLSRKHAGFEVRDIHYSSYGRVCPIETPEGANIGLINSLALFAKVDEHNLLVTPYRKVVNGKVTDEVVYMNAYEEESYVIAAADAVDPKTNKIKEGEVLARVKGSIKLIDSKYVQYVDLSPQQMLSVSASLIPFLEHDDANRALMGANMQRQAVPLLIPEEPLVATGYEHKVSIDGGGIIVAENPGKVIFVDASEIVILNDKDEIDTYYLPKFERTNQDTTRHFIPTVSKGQNVKKGDIIAEDLCCSNGQLALGKNVLVAFMSFEGYNFEDAILISERLVKDDVFTSITITEFETDTRETKLGEEVTTRDLPSEQITEEKLSRLDDEGIIRVGAEVKTGDILVGKIVPTKEQAITVEEKLLQAIFGKKLESGKVVPLEVPPGVRGKVIWRQVLARVKEKKHKSAIKKEKDLLKEEFQKIKNKIEKEKSEIDSVEKKVLDKYYKLLWEKFEYIKEQQKNRIEKGDDLPLTVLKSIKIYVASVRKIQVGDKLSGRHGNKGVVAKILPVEDMPFLPDGTPVDIVLSPLGVPSRMNVGQLLETMLGWAAKQLNIQYVTPPFDGASEEEVKEEIRKAKKYLMEQGVPEKYLPDDNCKITLYDGRTGEPFMEKVFVGYMYMMKLIHMVEDKIHARSTGPYSLVTKQPLGGKAHFGGQRFGEMEVWALEGYGAAYTLQEFLTVKSDDVEGRKKIYEDIIKGNIITYIGVPESFKVLIKELQALALNIDLLPKKYVKEKLSQKEQAKVKKD